MPQIIIDTKITKERDNLILQASRGNESIESILLQHEIQSIDDLVNWLLNRKWQLEEPEPLVSKRITITIHQETSPEGGTFWALDSIDSVEDLPEDTAKTGIENLPGWATWTAQEASDWIDANVTDLASAKTAIANMAKMICWLRDLN